MNYLMIVANCHQAINQRAPEKLRCAVDFHAQSLSMKIHAQWMCDSPPRVNNNKTTEFTLWLFQNISNISTVDSFLESTSFQTNRNLIDSRAEDATPAPQIVLIDT